jgi:hypothetical protein
MFNFDANSSAGIEIKHVKTRHQQNGSYFGRTKHLHSRNGNSKMLQCNRATHYMNHESQTVKAQHGNKRQWLKSFLDTFSSKL